MATDIMPEFTFGLSNDPIPEEKKSRRERRQEKSDPSPRGPGRPSNASVKKEVRDEIEAFIALMNVPLIMRDPVCGGKIMDQRIAIADALSEIAMHNPALLKFLRSGGDIMMYMKLITALSPVAMTVYEHHFSGHNQEEEARYEFGEGIVG